MSVSHLGVRLTRFDEGQSTKHALDPALDPKLDQKLDSKKNFFLIKTTTRILITRFLDLAEM